MGSGEGKGKGEGQRERRREEAEERERGERRSDCREGNEARPSSYETIKNAKSALPKRGN